MFKKVILVFIICLFSNMLQAQSTRIKSIARTSGEWENQWVIEYPWASVSLWDHFTQKQHHITIAVKAPLIYYGPFLKKGLLSEIYHPLNNSASSRWFREKQKFSSDMSFSPGSGQILFLGESTGGYLLNKAEKPLISGIIINFPVDSSIQLDLHFSQSQQPETRADNWYFVQKPFWGRKLYHPALGFHYKNNIFRLNAFMLAALSSLGEKVYCGSVQLELKQKSFSISLYAGKKEASFINPFGETSHRAYESSGLFLWKPQKKLEIKQSVCYQMDWPKKPQTRLLSGKTKMESQIQWLIHDQKKEQWALTGDFQWTRDFNEPQNLQDSLESHLSSQFSYQGFSLKISAGLNINKNTDWQIKNSLGYENEFFEAKLSQNWRIEQFVDLDYKATLSWKRQKSCLFLELKSLKTIEWGGPQDNKSSFFEQNRLSLGWESQVGSLTEPK